VPIEELAVGTLEAEAKNLYEKELIPVLPRYRHAHHRQRL
jgi:hypothetical protein